jgi:hypothetical protein
MWVLSVYGQRDSDKSLHLQATVFGVFQSKVLDCFNKLDFLCAPSCPLW